MSMDQTYQGQDPSEQEVRHLADKFAAEYGAAACAEARRMAIGFSALKDQEKSRLYIQAMNELKRRERAGRI